MADYLSNTPNQQEIMLKELGFNSLEELYSNLPQDLILQRPLNLELGQSEFKVLDTLKELANRDMISSLSEYGLLPKYGFPVDVVELKFNDLKRNKNFRKEEDKKFLKGIKLSRDIRYAITEFAPNQEIIVKKRMVKVNKILVPKDELEQIFCIFCTNFKKNNFFKTI